MKSGLRYAPDAWVIAATKQKQDYTANGSLRTDLDDPGGGDLEVVGGIVGGAAHRNKQVILPLRHARLRGWLQRAPRDEERCRHDIELPAELARDHQRLGDVRRFHETEPQPHRGKLVADGLHPDALGRIDARRLRG